MSKQAPEYQDLVQRALDDLAVRVIADPRSPDDHVSEARRHLQRGHADPAAVGAALRAISPGVLAKVRDLLLAYPQPWSTPAVDHAPEPGSPAG